MMDLLETWMDLLHILDIFEITDTLQQLITHKLYNYNTIHNKDDSETQSNLGEKDH